MVIFDGDFIRARVCPPEHDPPLIVDPDRVTAATVALERFQAITRRNSEIGQFTGLIELDEGPPDGVRPEWR